MIGLGSRLRELYVDGGYLPAGQQDSKGSVL